MTTPRPRGREEEGGPAIPTERCANCGTALAGAFCHGCGQEASDPPATLSAFTSEVLRDVFHLRSRTLRSLGTLIARPGELTRAYFDGRRIRFTSPVKVYLLCATAFFLVNEFRPFITITEDNRVVSSLSAADVVAGFATEVERLEAEGVPRELFWERFRATATRSLPHFMVGSIVVFALALAAFTPHRPALRHGVFALHWTGFFLLFMAVERLLPRLAGPVDFVALAFVLAVLLHLVLSVRRAYGHGWGRALASGLGLFLVFNVILAAWIMAVVTYAFGRVG